MNREPEIEKLLNDARNAAIEAYSGQPATLSVLAAMGAHAREAVLVQADFGLWRPWTVESRADLIGLRCNFKLSLPTLVGQGEAPIALLWDFKTTLLRFLETR